ncbi:unnamed protein product [Ilex paraguariensis]|uniref:Uncharacterized protein n=1 Tax=Ilex paraguariensis TaxID=185542 RepID=A0ABC8U2G9_9AQUA
MCASTRGMICTGHCKKAGKWWRWLVYELWKNVVFSSIGQTAAKIGDHLRVKMLNTKLLAKRPKYWGLAKQARCLSNMPWEFV